jgi:hypothetical protein
MEKWKIARNYEKNKKKAKRKPASGKNLINFWNEH